MGVDTLGTTKMKHRPFNLFLSYRMDKRSQVIRLSERAYIKFNVYINNMLIEYSPLIPLEQKRMADLIKYKRLQKRPALTSVTDVNQIVFIHTPVVFFAANDSIESRLQSV
ncbi:MAG: hypothetical protein ACR2PX_24765 [Endozoicomonas sp.]|uniref:hypothetical protein n=1 Tax=Endozoicomonas sp. TaxID=1892382 RepID=UPI003D9B83A8